MDINSYYIKTVLMEYWRFNRQCLCADEVMTSDIIIIRKDGLVHEIEVKCAKNDLCNLELKKSKHYNTDFRFCPHYFSFAVPTELVEDAKTIINKLNPKYGLIEINTKLYPPVCIRISPKKIHDYDTSNELWKERVIYRLNSALIGYMKRTHLNEDKND